MRRSWGDYPEPRQTPKASPAKLRKTKKRVSPKKDEICHPPLNDPVDTKKYDECRVFFYCKKNVASDDVHKKVNGLCLNTIISPEGQTTLKKKRLTKSKKDGNGRTVLEEDIDQIMIHRHDDTQKTKGTGIVFCTSVHVSKEVIEILQRDEDFSEVYYAFIREDGN